MKKIPYGLMMLLLLLCPVTYANAQVSFGIGLPNVSIGINLPLLPNLVPVPGYPVYYAPGVAANYFFYDGMYWVYQDDNWYASTWYNGPWGFVEPEAVPLFVLRIPVRYYLQPPVYFRGWQSNAPPRWGQHWGRGWEQQRSGWNRWNRASVPARAPLPAYQRQYSGDRYPHVEQQQSVRSQSYRYQPRDRAVREHFKQQTGQPASAAPQRGRQGEPVHSQRPQDPRHSPQPQRGAPPDPHSQPPQRGGESARRPAPDQRQHSESVRHEQPAPGAQGQGQGQRGQERGEFRESPDSNHSRGEGQNRDEGRGGGRNN